MLFTFYAASLRCSIKHSQWPISNWQALPTPCYIMCEGKGWGQAVSRRLVHLSDQAKLWNSYSGVWDFYNLTFPNLQKNQTKLTLSEKWRDLACFLVVSLITFCRSSSRDRSIMTYRLELNPSDHRQVLSNFLQVKKEKYDQSSAFFTFPSNSNVQKWTEEHSPDLKLVPSDGSDPVEAPSLHFYLHSPTLRLVRQLCFGTCNSVRRL